MPPFYNRHPWNLVVGFGVLVGGLIALSAATTWWLLLAPFTAIALVFVWKQFSRAYALFVLGYHSVRVGRATLRYEERAGLSIRSFELKLEYTEPGRVELFVPSSEMWASQVPDWAKARRKEICSRIAQTWRASDVHLKEDPTDA